MKTKTLSLLSAAMIVATLVGCSDQSNSAQPSPKEQENVTVGVVQLVEHPALDAANRGIVDGLKERGLSVNIDQQNAQADQSNLSNIAQRFVSQEYPLIFAIATPAAQSVANATKTTPIVATAVTNFEIANLVQSNAKPGTNVTGVSDLNPVAEQVKLMLALVPNAKRVGTIYNSSEINSQYQVEILRKELAARNLELVEMTVSGVNDVQQNAQSLIDKIDVMYVPTDNIIASSMPILTKLTTPAKIPVITGEEGGLQGGGLATIGVDYYQLGKLTGHMGADILEGKAKPADMAIQHQTTFQVTVNETVLKQLGLTLPESIAKDAKLVQY